jgi:hypothetical protein
LNALAAGELSGFSEAERLAVALARELTLLAPERTHDQQPQIASADLLDRARETFPPPALVELVAGIGAWNAVTRWHRAMGLEQDMPEPPAGVRAAL